MSIARARITTDIDLDLNSNNYYLLTFDQFEQLPEFGAGYELVDGRLVQKPMPGEEHGRIADDLYFALRMFDKNWQLGRAWREITVKVRSDERNGRTPDLCYVLASRQPPKTQNALEVVPDLVVEVWSPSDIVNEEARNSTRLKMRYWPDNGVRLTWCVDPARREVEVLHAAPTKQDFVQELSTDDELDGEDIIPGFRLKLSELFG
jgi:Uma2 family endonuclease